MADPDVAIRVRGLGKHYLLAHDKATGRTLSEALRSAALAPLQRFRELRGTSQTMESFWALRDVSFDVPRGEVLGVVGRNGAGKSTLLKVLSRIVEPTEGEVTMRGRVASLLEVGTGFHPELTGRENIFLNGAILGMRRKEIKGKFDEIVSFAEVEKFLDTPVKRYSSGMYVRLAFAVAAHLEPDILIVDEVLAVGDAQFQQKCIGKMRSIVDGGARTVVFVSHNMGALRTLCTSGLLLAGGRKAAEGPVERVIAGYVRSTDEPGRHEHAKSRFGIALYEAGLYVQESLEPAAVVSFQQPCEIRVKFGADAPLEQCGVFVRISDEQGILVSTMISYKEGVPPFPIRPSQSVAFKIGGMSLMPGRYSASVAVQRPHDPTQLLSSENCFRFEVLPALLPEGTLPYQSKHGLVRIVDACVLGDP